MYMHGILWFAAFASRGGASSSDLDFLEAPPPYNPGQGSSNFGSPTYGAGYLSSFSGKCLQGVCMLVFFSCYVCNLFCVSTHI